MPLLFPGFWMFPSQFDLDLLLPCVQIEAATPSWSQWYRKQYEAERIMRDLALAYSE